MSAFITRPWKQFLRTVLMSHAQGLLCARLSSLHRSSHGIIILTPQSRHFQFFTSLKVKQCPVFHLMDCMLVSVGSLSVPHSYKPKNLESFCKDGIWKPVTSKVICFFFFFSFPLLCCLTCVFCPQLLSLCYAFQIPANYLGSHTFFFFFFESLVYLAITKVLVATGEI